MHHAAVSLVARREGAACRLNPMLSGREIVDLEAEMIGANEVLGVPLWEMSKMIPSGSLKLALEVFLLRI